MEYVEGETLAKRLEKGPLPLDQVPKYGAQIADALDKAHRAGIVHRDLKPGNIMLTSSGAKLLDFGLARPVAPAATLATLSMASPAQAPATQEGMIVGTFQYMSPDQVEGKDVDGRSDIFSLGAVLYEALTGKRAFEGKSQLSVASAILEKEPAPISTVKPLTPPALEHSIKKCLAKAPEERWQSASDLSSELKWVVELTSRPEASTASMGLRVKRERLIWVSALTATIVALAAVIFPFKRSATDSQILRTTLLPPTGGTFVFSGPSGGAFISPDGRSVAAVVRSAGETRIWVRPVDDFEARPLTGTEGASFIFWSPDGQNLGFFAGGKLKRIAAKGSPTQTLCDADTNRGGSWNSQDAIIFSRMNGEIYKIPATGGTPERVTRLNTVRHELSHRWPSFLPDGNHFVYMASPLGPMNQENTFRIGSLDGKDDKVLFQGSSPIIYAMGYLIYLNEKALMARPFDAERLETTGVAVPVGEGVQFDPLWSNGSFSASRNGVLLYQQGKSATNYSLLLFDREGKQVVRSGNLRPILCLASRPTGSGFCSMCLMRAAARSK